MAPQKVFEYNGGTTVNSKPSLTISEKEMNSIVEYYEKTKASCPDIIQNATNTLKIFREEIGWGDVEEKENPSYTEALEQVQIKMSRHLQQHTEALEIHYKELKKKGDYIPQLLRITKEQVQKEEKRILHIYDKLVNSLESPLPLMSSKLMQVKEMIDEPTNHLTLLHEEISENLPKWSTHILGYAMSLPYCQAINEFIKKSLDEDTRIIEKGLKEMASFKHPFPEIEKNLLPRKK